MTPSLPTFANASAMISPIRLSWAETVATWAISCCSSTSRATLSRLSDTAAAAASMPRFIAIGLAPAATARSPSRTMAWARTVAVVVPSPATSLVLVATSFASWAPRFSSGSSSSTSRATVTPSLVMVGAPHFLSITTLRPLGPSVTLTASARWFTPRSSARRASSSNSKLLAMNTSECVRPDLPGWPGLAGSPCCHDACAVMAPPRQPLVPRPARDHEPDRGGGTRRRARGLGPAPPACLLLLDGGQHVAGGEHEVLLAAVLDLGAAVLAVQHHVADLDIHRDALGAGLVEPARAHRDDLALLGLLLGGVRDDQPGRGGLLGLERLHHDPVLERVENNLGGGRHDLTSPSEKG